MSYTAWGSLNLPTCWIWYIRSPPFTYSMTKYRRSCGHAERKKVKEELWVCEKSRKKNNRFYVKNCRISKNVYISIRGKTSNQRNTVLRSCLPPLSKLFHLSCYSFHDKVTQIAHNKALHGKWKHSTQTSVRKYSLCVLLLVPYCPWQVWPDPSPHVFDGLLRTKQ